MKLYFNMATRERRAAVVENNEVVEVMIERPMEDRIVNNIYRGKVVRVLPGMQAAFVDIGREKNGFLYRDDLLSFHLSNEEEEVKKKRSISHYVTQGEEILVQVTKEEFGTKGPRLTGVISIPGQYIIYMPEGGYVGVSRSIEDEEEREMWRDVGEAIRKENEGFIIRTACAGKQMDVIKGELHSFRTYWQQIMDEAKQRKAPSLVYQSSSLLERLIRDFSGRHVEEIVIDQFDKYMLVKEMLAPYPHLQQVVRLYRGNENIFSAYGIEKEIEKALHRQVWLKNGAYLMIDQTEALTVIDVNTGKFTGTSSLDDTIRKTNMEAAKEIARQLRLRDISGMIVIDFIDMKNEEDREELLRQLKLECKKDRTKTNILGITELGLVEMTRKKVRQNLLQSLSKQCPTCLGKGVILSDEAQAFKIERSLWEYRNKDIEALVLELPSKIAPVLFGQDGSHLKRLEEALGLRIFVFPNKQLREETFYIRYVGEVEEAINQLERLKEARK